MSKASHNRKCSSTKPIYAAGRVPGPTARVPTKVKAAYCHPQAEGLVQRISYNFSLGSVTLSEIIVRY